MKENENHGNVELKIIETARDVFIQKGFQETSMSDIAAKVGINRPTLHYYFRTKDKMFHAVLQSIVVLLLPKIKDIIISKDLSLEKKIESIIDVYFDIFQNAPCTPLFVMREANRNISFLVDAIKTYNLDYLFLEVRDALLQEMDSGHICRVPCRFIFLTFYGLMTMPFTSKGICCEMFLNEGESFEDMLKQWKTYVTSEMMALLSVKV